MYTKGQKFYADFIDPLTGKRKRKSFNTASSATRHERAMKQVHRANPTPASPSVRLSLQVSNPPATKRARQPQSASSKWQEGCGHAI